MKLYPEHLSVEVTPEGVIFENEFCGYLRSHGYPVNDITDTRVVESESSPHAYLVQKIETMALPDGHPDLDIVAHETTLPICSCDSFRYHESPNVDEPNVHPTDARRCKHIISEYRTEKAKEDDNQDTLV